MTDIPASVRQQAAQWLVDLQDPGATSDMRRAWQRWVDAHPDHARAWGKVETLAAKASLLPAGGIARASLIPARPMRRRMLGIAATGLAGLAAWQLTDDIRHPGRLETAAGERRDLHLADGSHLILNTRTDVQVRFDPTQRLVILNRGELWIATAADPHQPERPLRVRTRAGDMQAVGTQFTVRHDDDTLLRVLDGAVDVRPAGSPGPAIRVPALHQLQFSANRHNTLHTSTDADAATAWTRGMLLATDMPLPDFIAELARYRAGLLDVDPALGRLRVSGTFPLDDTDQVLRLLQQVLPLRVQYRTRYWVRLLPRDTA